MLVDLHKDKEKKKLTMQFNNNKLDPEDFYYSKEGFKVFTRNLSFKKRILL